MSLLFLLPLVLACTATPDVPVAASPAAKPQEAPQILAVEVPLARVTLPPEARKALLAGDIATAASTMQTAWGDVDPDHAFVLAWYLMAAGHSAEAAPLGPLAAKSSAPTPYRLLLQARLDLAANQAAEALLVLESFPSEVHLRRLANLERGHALEALGRQPEAEALYKELAEVQPFIADKADEGALRALLALHPGSADIALRLWSRHPAAIPTASLPRPPTWQESAIQAEILQAAGDFAGAAALMEPFQAHIGGTSEDACRARYALGRSWYKLNKASQALGALGTAPTDCVTQGDYSVKTGYLLGRANVRAGRYREGASVLQKLSQDWPDSSYADDGLVLAGNALEKAGDLAGARKLWDQAMIRYPNGDMTPQAGFQLAWSHYEAGQAAAAIDAALRLADLPPDLGLSYSAAGRYWAGRWSLYPSKADPNLRDATGAARAVEQWTRLCQEQPWTYPAVLAYSRLVEEAPDQAALVQGRVSRALARSSWELDASFRDDPAVQAAAGLLALGMIPEARDELATLDPVALSPHERAWLTLLREQGGDGVAAHVELRTWSATWAPSGPDAIDLLRVVFPDLWWREVQAASKGYRFPPRYFQAIVRTESNFVEGAISSAGARGLSQIMPATGKSVGAWLGLKVAADDLYDPALNLRIGARYQDSLHQRFQDSPYLSAAGYNAGEGRVGQWLGERRALPIDDFVEAIPIEEPRLYVWRVVGTWQAYRWIDGEGLPDLSRFNRATQK